MITFQVDQASLQHVQKKLGTMQSKAPIVISRALNKTAVSARQRLANRAQQAYTVKSGGIQKTICNQEGVVRKPGGRNQVSGPALLRSQSLNIQLRSPEPRQTSQRVA